MDFPIYSRSFAPYLMPLGTLFGEPGGRGCLTVRSNCDICCPRVTLSVWLNTGLNFPHVSSEGHNRPFVVGFPGKVLSTEPGTWDALGEC